MTGAMRLRVLTPSALLCETEATKVHVQTVSGWWTFLPAHRDMVTLVVPGILTCTGPAEAVLLIAMSEGLLAKRKGDVTLSVRHAVSGGTAEELLRIVKEQYTGEDDAEAGMARIIARLESDFVRCFVGMN